MHSEAEHFDIGLYFEANGHGAVLVKPSVFKEFKNIQGIQKIVPQDFGLEYFKQLNILETFLKLSN